jgi:hypothetical protein
VCIMHLQLQNGGSAVEMCHKRRRNLKDRISEGHKS